MKSKSLVKICLMAISLSACKQNAVDSFPKLHPSIISVKSQLHLPYRDLGGFPRKFSATDTWKPLMELDGYYCLPPEDVGAIVSWEKLQPIEGAK